MVAGAEERTFAFQIGYWATGFDGYARQPGRVTVEGTIRDGLRKRGLLTPEGEAAFRSASRTDRGVHALGNVVAFPTPVAGASAARGLGALHPRIFCFGYREVPAGFEPRHARERWYRYLEPGAAPREERWQRWARRFEGEHDFASFSRRDDPPRPTRLTVREFRVAALGADLVLDVRAPRFLWHQVRKMVGALQLLDRGELGVEALDAALAGRRSVAVGPAPPERLLLMEVLYDEPFLHPPALARVHERFLRETEAGIRLHQAVLRVFRRP